MGFDDATNQVLYNQITSLMLMKRLGEPEDIANLASFLLSDDAKNITGKWRCF